MCFSKFSLNHRKRGLGPRSQSGDARAGPVSPGAGTTCVLTLGSCFTLRLQSGLEIFLFCPVFSASFTSLALLLMPSYSRYLRTLQLFLHRIYERSIANPNEPELKKPRPTGRSRVLRKCRRGYTPAHPATPSLHPEHTRPSLSSVEGATFVGFRQPVDDISSERRCADSAVGVALARDAARRREPRRFSAGLPEPPDASFLTRRLGPYLACGPTPGRTVRARGWPGGYRRCPRRRCRAPSRR